MSKEIKDRGAIIGPVQIDAKIHFRVGDQTGEVTFGFPPGRPITEKDILAAIGKSLIGIRNQFDDCELLDANEFFNGVLVAEKTGRGGKFALPSSFDYDSEKLEADALLAAKEQTP